MSETNLFEKDLNPFIDKVSLNDTIYLVRKISGHVLEMELIEFLTGTNPAVMVCWIKRRSMCYKLVLEKNEVIAEDATVKHRQEMKQWWTLWEIQRQLLLKEWIIQNAKTKKKRKRI